MDMRALGGDVSANEKRGSGRRVINFHAACAVCARLGWERRSVYFWRQAANSGRQSLLSDVPRCARDQHFGNNDDACSPRDVAAKWFDPSNYHKRWSFRRHDSAVLGGIPLSELQASAVREPRTGRLWLLHKKVFRYVWDEELMALAADPNQTVPVCVDCCSRLQGKKPSLPKYALPNDLWMGRLPPVLQGLPDVAWLLLALARPLIRRYTCFHDGAKAGDPEEHIKGFVGNTAAFLQQDGGALLNKLPPDASDLVDRILIAFVGSDGDLRRSFCQEFSLDVDKYRAAYEYLRAHNAVYERVQWDENAAAFLQPGEDCMGLPKVR